jgi:hypothetical protein
MVLSHGTAAESSHGMLKKARLLTCPTPVRRDAPFRERGRNEYRAQEVQAALRVGRSSLQWILTNGKGPPALPTCENLFGTLRVERCENEAGGLFQHAASRPTG